MTSHFRASVFQGTGQPFTMESFFLPPLKTGEVLIRISCCTLCGSDYHSILGRRSTPVPSILGHEAVGIVESLGPATERIFSHTDQLIQVGDRVVWGLVASCGHCRLCLRGMPQKCERLFKYGHEQFHEGEAPSGGLSEFCVLRPGTPLLHVPASIPDSVAATIGCAGATVAATLRVAALRRGESVLIFGAGMLGLAAAAMAREAGAGLVTVADPDTARVERSTRFGATNALLLQPEDHAANLLSDASGCGGFDVVLEFSGAPSAFQDGLECLGTGGRMILAGAVYPMPPASVDAERIVRRLLRIEGVHNYTLADLAQAVGFFGSPAAQAYPFAEEIRGPFTLESINAAVACGMADRPLRVCVAPNAP